MTEESKKILEDYKNSLLNELEEYVKLCTEQAKWRMNFWKKHKTDIEGITQFGLLHQLDLSAYYAYGNAKDIINEKFEEIINRLNKKENES